MPVRKTTISDTAAMSRLEFTPVDLDGFTADLMKIYAYFDSIRNVETATPETQAIPETDENVWREDKVKPSLSRPEALLNAPETDEGYFIVPRVIG